MTEPQPTNPEDTTIEGWMKRPEATVTWDIDQIMAKDTTLIIAGNTGIGKSWETMHLAFCLASGSKWHGLKCRQMSPIYITTELTKNQVLRRLKKLSPQYPGVKGIHFISAKGFNYRLNDLVGRTNLLRLLDSKTTNGTFGAIILDPLALFIKDKIDQVNWNNDIEPVLNELKKRYQCSLILNHNFRKKTQVYGHEEDSFSTDRLKGVADLGDRADNIVVFVSESGVRRNSEGKSERIEVSKWMAAIKTRDAEQGLPPFRVKWNYDKGLFEPEEGSLVWLGEGAVTIRLPG